jgi:hypothetical protein
MSTTLERRMAKLEQAQPRGVEAMTNEELEVEICELRADPKFQAWLADESDNDPVRLETLRLLRELRLEPQVKQ